ncbi:MAG TPA: hypothetical protein VHW23_34025 [Kofleriaceae bacterium]|nr:hypothetical protein [Kofleriaceae bacterium]
MRVATPWLAVAVLAIAGCNGPRNLGIPDDGGGGGGDGGGGSGDGGSGDGGGSGSTAITIRAFADGVPTFTGVTENVPLLAFQDGDGAWTPLTGTGGVYHATATGARYGVAVGCADPDGSLTVYYQAVSDATELPVQACFHLPDDPANITVNLQNADGRQSVVSVGVNSRSVMGSGSATMAVAKQKADVFVATQIGPDGSATDPRALRSVTLDVSADAALGVDVSAALPLESHALTIVDAQPGGSVETFAQVLSQFYTQYSFGPRELFHDTLTPNLPLTATASYRTPAAAMRLPGEIMYALARTSGNTAAGVGYTRDAIVQTANVASLTLTLPEIVIADPPTVDDAAIPRATATLPIRPAALGHAIYDASFSTSTAQTSRVVDVQIRPGWAQGQSTVTVTTPDLSGVAGWTTDMALLPGVNVGWTLLIDDRNVTLETPVRDGKRILQSSLSGTIERTAPVAGRSAQPARRAADALRRIERLAR